MKRSKLINRIPPTPLNKGESLFLMKTTIFSNDANYISSNNSFKGLIPPFRRVGGLMLILFIFTLQSCMDDDALRDFDRLNTKETAGVFITNEGNFMSSNASLSYYKANDKEVLNDVFYNTNALPLGDVAQSMVIRDSLAYIVVNNSGKIYVINKNTFKYVSKITGLGSPRHMLFINDAKAYVSDLYAKAITIIDPLSNSIIGTINLDNNNPDLEQHSSEKMLLHNKKVYVACWSQDNKILVLNSESDLVEDSITVGKQPNSMVLDKNNQLWVLSDGGFMGASFGQEKASLTQIDLSNNSIVKTLVFDDIDVSPTHLQINARGDSLFYIYGSWSMISGAGIHAMSISDVDLPQLALINQQTGLFYALGLDKANNELYISNAKDYSQAGEVYRFTSSGTAIDTFNVGITPGSFCFDK